MYFANIYLDQGHVALAERIVERAAQYEQDLKHSNDVEDSEVAALQRDLSTEYYMMRIALVFCPPCIIY